MAQKARDGEDMSLWYWGTGTFPLSEKIIAATQSSHDAIENVRFVPGSRKSQNPHV
jgi:hypothetical protein